MQGKRRFRASDVIVSDGSTAMKAGNIARLAGASWGQVIAGLVQIASLRFYTEMLGPEGFGSAILALGVLALLDGIGVMAFSQTLPQLIKDEPDRTRRVNKALATGLDAAKWLAIIGAGAALATAAVYSLFEGAIALVAATLYAAAEPVRSAGQKIAMMDRRVNLLSAWVSTEAIATLAGSLLAIVILEGSVLSLVVGAVTGRALVAFAFSVRALGHPAGWNFDRIWARVQRTRLLGIAIPIALAAPLGWAAGYADRYIIAGTVGLVEAGILAALVGVVVRPFTIVGSGLTTLYRPDLLDDAAGRLEHGKRPLRDWNISALAIGLAGVAAVGLLGPWVAGLVLAFPISEYPVRTIMILLAISQTAAIVTHSFDNFTLAAERSRLILLTQAATLPFGLAAILVGSLFAGLSGAAGGRIVQETLRLAAAAALARYVMRTGTGTREGRPA